MPARCPHCRQMLRSPTAARRREIILDALRPGKWVHGEKLAALAYPDMVRGNLRSLIHRMRAEGYQIESERKGTGSRGYRLIAEPQQMKIAA